MLDGGIVHGQLIVNHVWIEQSLASQVAISASDPYADFYGYMWYTKAEPVGSHEIEVHFASGNGGNKIYMVPSLHMVIAITSSADNKSYGQRRSQDILFRIRSAAGSKFALSSEPECLGAVCMVSATGSDGRRNTCLKSTRGSLEA